MPTWTQQQEIDIARLIALGYSREDALLMVLEGEDVE
jgi:hypothetical protein